VLDTAERYFIYREEDTNPEDESTNSNDDEEEDLLLEKELESFSKDADVLL
jgi:hypothetical protein